MMAGMAEATRDMAVGYAKLREQFGQAIGAFQAIKHICADAALRAEAATCQLMFAAIETQKQSSLAPMHVTAAKLTAADALLQNAAANIQVHGGIGFTAECDAHLYMKRAHVLEQLLGSQRWHQSVMGKGQQFTIVI
jgi:alkylation response protein AidB-like acyl-CoA dehydrogenase